MKKRIIGLILVICILISNITFAECAYTNSSDASSIVYKAVEAINNKAYVEFSNYFIQSEKEIFDGFFVQTENRKNNIGLFNVNTTSIKEIMEVPDILCSKWTNISDMKNSFDDLHCFVVGMDCNVAKEDKYFYNGINYELFIVGNIEGQWKIIELSQAPMDIINSLGYSFGSQDEKDAVKIIKARYKGNYINKSGELLGTNRNCKSDNNKDSDVVYYVPGELIPPSTIDIYLTETDTKVTKDFYYYIKNVLPNEWTASTDPMESLKTGAMCVKMYGWFHTIYPKAAAVGCDVYDDTSCQVYVAGTEYWRSTDAIDSISSIGITNSTGDLFETAYLQTYSGTYGVVSQLGANSLATNNNYTYIEILRYYYDNKIENFWQLYNIGRICFFNY